MKERPIPYSPEMVRARREGRKTKTRRELNPQPPSIEDVKRDCGTGFHIAQPWPSHLCKFGVFGPVQSVRSIMGREPTWTCPYGQRGDFLWVREAWVTLAEFNWHKPSQLPKTAPIWYLADGPAPAGYGRYRHARFMPRWVSRSLDEVVSVRVERLHDISEADAKAEGFNSRQEFIDFVLKLNKLPPGANPWVWVVEFKVVTP